MRMSKEEFLHSAGLDIQTAELWIEQHWLIPEPSAAGPTFSDREIARARLILDLRSTFRVNDEGIDVILHLVDQIHGLRDALTQMRDGLSQEKT